MKILSLDPSSRTGYSIFDNGKLIKFGLLEKEIRNFTFNVSSYNQLPKDYPVNLLDSSTWIAKEIMVIIKAHNIKHVVLEHTEGSSRRFSQRYLEWLHMSLVLAFLKHGIEFKYLLNSDWKKVTKCYLKHWPEYDKHNKEVRKMKKKATPTASGAKVARKDGKVLTVIDTKRLSCLLASQRVGKEIDNDNIADSILIGYAAIELNLFS